MNSLLRHTYKSLHFSKLYSIVIPKQFYCFSNQQIFPKHRFLHACKLYSTSVASETAPIEWIQQFVTEQTKKDKRFFLEPSIIPWTAKFLSISNSCISHLTSQQTSLWRQDFYTLFQEMFSLRNDFEHKDELPVLEKQIFILLTEYSEVNPLVSKLSSLFFLNFYKSLSLGDESFVEEELMEWNELTSDFITSHQLANISDWQSISKFFFVFQHLSQAILLQNIEQVTEQIIPQLNFLIEETNDFYVLYMLRAIALSFTGQLEWYPTAQSDFILYLQHFPFDSITVKYYIDFILNWFEEETKNQFLNILQQPSLLQEWKRKEYIDQAIDFCKVNLSQYVLQLSNPVDSMIEQLQRTKYLFRLGLQEEALDEYHSFMKRMLDTAATTTASAVPTDSKTVNPSSAFKFLFDHIVAESPYYENSSIGELLQIITKTYLYINGLLSEETELENMKHLTPEERDSVTKNMLQSNLKELNTLVQKNPNNIVFLLQRAWFYLVQEKFELAEMDVKSALEKNPNSVLARSYYAMIAATLIPRRKPTSFDFETSLRYAKECVELLPTWNASSMSGMEEAYIHLLFCKGDAYFDQVLELIEQYLTKLQKLKCNKAKLMMLNTRVIICKRRDMIEQAIRDLTTIAAETTIPKVKQNALFQKTSLVQSLQLKKQ